MAGNPNHPCLPGAPGKVFCEADASPGPVKRGKEMVPEGGNSGFFGRKPGK